ncbi:MAG: hormogonium polysaccharide biosynthesis glycosyltransferase HpsN [Halothece sp.]
MTLPLVSVVIPTYLREETLCDTLADVMQEDYPNFEVLVVDQTRQHKPEVEAYLNELAEADKIRWFRVDFASLPGARNYAIRRAQGDIILFIDDDVKFDKGLLKAHVQSFLDKPDVGAVAGRVLDRQIMANEHPDFVIEELPPEAMDGGKAWYYLNVTHTIKPQYIISARGCNMSFRREIFEQHGIYFDERMRGSAVREESDVCLRVQRKAGYRIWYNPEAVLVHLGEPTGGCHDISTRSLEYQITHYHNHFWMAFKNLTLGENLRLYVRLFDCHVLGHPPCNKSPSLHKTIVRGFFYFWGYFSAVGTAIKSLWDNGQIYTSQDVEMPTFSFPKIEKNAEVDSSVTS